MLVAPQLVQKLPVSCGTQTFLTVAPELLRYFNTVAKLQLFDLLLLLSDWYDVYKRILDWVVGRHLPVKVKIDGAVGYGVGSVSEQSVREVVSGIRDAVNRVIDVLIL
jgi:hypothetical protein